MLGSFLPLSCAGSGRSAARVIVKIDHLTEIDDRLVDILVLAELVIGGIQVGEVQPVEGLDVGTHRGRIVERGRYEFVDIDRFDVEGLLHVRAAVAKKLHHLRLILRRIEMRLHRLGLGRDLAQRQRGGENLDQNGVHRERGGQVRGRGDWITAIIAI